MKDFNLNSSQEELHIPLPFHSEGLGEALSATLLANHSIGAERTVKWLYDQFSRSSKHSFVWKMFSAKPVLESPMTGIQLAGISALFHDVG